MAALENGNYPRSWSTCTVSYDQSYHSVMEDFHEHSYYEISLILTGNVRSLLSERAVEGTQIRLVLTAPRTPHWMSLAEPSLYTRVNLFFSDEFIADYVPEWKSLRKVFGENGNVILLTEEQGDFCKEKMFAIKEEPDHFRQRLRIFEFLSYLREFDSQAVEKGIEPPPYIVEALTYIDEHYPERIVAHELAWHLDIGRTTLMTSFRRYTGSTLAEYVLRLRVKKAIALLRQGVSQERVAEQVGLSNGSGLIRAFRHCYGMTPKQYIKQYPSKKKANQGEEPRC